MQGKSRDHLSADALIERLGVPVSKDLHELSRDQSAATSTAVPPNERLPLEKIQDLENRLATDFGLSVQLSDLIAPPITEDKLRVFLLGNSCDAAT